MNKKAILMVLLIFTIIFSITTVNAVDNITLDSDSSIEGEVEMPTERLEVNFDNTQQTLSFKVTDDSVHIDEDMNYDFYVNNKMRAGGSTYYSNNERTTKNPNQYIHTLKYYEDGEHNLLIKHNDYGKTKIMFNVTFNVKNNISLSDNIILQNSKTVKYSIVNGAIPYKYGDSNWVTLKDGWNNLSEYSLLGSGSGSTKPIILKVYYRGYIVGGVDITNKTTLSVSDSTFYINGYKSYNSWSYNQNEIKLPDQISWDGIYNYQYKSSIIVPTKVKEPIYAYKKVKNGYKWKYYKTKWHKTKIVTHKLKKGKLTVYNSKLRKVRNLLKHNGKITKTVYTSKKRTVYIKYPVDYYKKVRKYKQKRYIAGYETITKNVVKYIWVDAKGTAEQISSK